MASQATRLVVEIDGSGAKTGAQVVNNALKSIEASVAAAEKSRLAFQTNLSKLGGTGLDAAVAKINSAFKSISDQVALTKKDIVSLATPFAHLAKSAATSAYEVKLAMRAMSSYIATPKTAIKELGWMFRDLGVHAHASTALVKAAMREMSSVIVRPEAAIKELGWMFRDLGVHAHASTALVKAAMKEMSSVIVRPEAAIKELGWMFRDLGVHAHSSTALVKSAMRDMSSAIRHPESALKELGWMFMDLGAYARAGVTKVQTVMSDLSTLIKAPESSLTSLATAFAKIGNQKFNALVEAFQMIDSAIKLTKGKVNSLVETFAKIETAAKNHLLEAGREVIKLGNAFTGKPMQAVVAFSNKLLELGIDATIGMKAATSALVGLATAMIPLVRKIANISSKFGKLGASIEAGLAPVWTQLLRLGNAFAFPKEKVAEFSVALASIGTGSGKHLKPIITALRDLGEAFSTSILAAKRLRAVLGRIGTAASAGTDKAIVSLYDLGKQARVSLEDVKVLSKVLKRLGVNATYGIGQARTALIKLTRSLKLPLASLSKLGFAFNNVGVQAEIGVSTARTSLIQLYRALKLALPAVSKLGFALSNLGVQAEIGIKKANAAIRSLKTAFTAPTKAVTALKRSLGTIGTAANNAAKKVNTAMKSMEKALARPKLHVKILANAMRNIGTQAAAAAKKVSTAMKTISADLKAPGKAAKDFADALRKLAGTSFTRFNTGITTLAKNTRSLVTAIDALTKAVDKLYASLIKVTAAAKLAADAFDKLAVAAGAATHSMGTAAGAATRSTKAFDSVKNAVSKLGTALKVILSPFNLLRKALKAVWTLLTTTAKAILYIGKVSLTATVGVAKLAGKLANLATLGIAGRLGRLALKIITLGRAGKTAAKDIGVLTKAYRLFRNIYMARLAGGGLSGMQKSIVDARIEWDKMRSTFVAVTGSTAGSRKELEWLRETADDLGSSFTHAAFPFAKLAAAAKGTALEGEGVRKIFEDISVATTTLHMSGDDLKFTFYALQQMISKGSVTMEELRRQLGERIPGAFQDAAKAYAKMKGDITLGTDDLEKAIKAGLVDPIEFLPLLAEEIALRFKDGLMIARVALQAEINRMVTMWFFFKKEISEGPLDDAWITFTQTLTEAIERMMPHAKSIGEFLARIVDWAGEWVEILTAHPDAVSDFLNLSGWGRLYDYINNIATAFLNANFPGLSSNVEGLGSAFSFLFDTVWLLPDILIEVGHIIEQEIDRWPEVWESFKGVLVALLDVLRIEVEKVFSVMMVNVQNIVIEGLNATLAAIAEGARQLSSATELTAGKAAGNFWKELTKEGEGYNLFATMGNNAVDAIVGNATEIVGGIANTIMFDPIATKLESLEFKTVDVAKKVADAETKYANQIVDAKTKVGLAYNDAYRIQKDIMGDELKLIETTAKAKHEADVKAREAARQEYEFKKLDREDTKFELGISSGGNIFEDSDAKIAKAEAEIRKANQDKNKPTGSGSGSGAKGKTPSQILAEENKLRKEKYDLEHQYLTIMEETYPGIYEMELRGLEADYARTEAKLKMDEALQKGIITEEQHLKVLEALEIQYDRTMEAASKYLDTYMEVANILSGAFGDLASAAKDSFGEQSTAYKALFAASKAFAVVEAAIAIQVALAKALTLPPPLNLVEYAKVAALGATIVSTIASASYSGEYDQGGAIPAGSYGMVGEYGPEFVKGPATVTGRGDTAKMIAELVNLMKQREGEGGGSRGGNVRIINAVDPSLMEEYIGSDNGERVVMNVIRRNASSIKQWTQ